MFGEQLAAEMERRCILCTSDPASVSRSINPLPEGVNYDIQTTWRLLFNHGMRSCDHWLRTSNDESWSFLTPTDGQLFTYTGSTLPISATGTANAASSSNQIAVIDPSNHIFLAQPVQMTSAAGASPNAWNATVNLDSIPQGPPGKTHDIAICTGTPKPTITGTGATKFVRRYVKVKFDPLVMMPPGYPTAG